MYISGHLQILKDILKNINLQGCKIKRLKKV